MKTLYFECNMGIAGDMTMAALYELIDEKEKFLDTMNNLGIPNLKIIPEETKKCGITGTYMNVLVDDVKDVKHLHLSEIGKLINGLNVSDDVKKNAIAIYHLLGEAESRVHGEKIEHIHFHEISSLDAVADIVGSCLLVKILNVDKITSSVITTGSGQVKCEHGILPVPAPATAELLIGVPIKSGPIESELCTPTGAAIIKYFASGFGENSQMTLEKIGYGFGKKDFPAANCLRVFLGYEENQSEKIIELSTNVDDMTAEEIGFATEMLLKSGALEVFTTSVYMKKNRPGTLLTCICDLDKRDRLVHQIFLHTSTLGIREISVARHRLSRNEEILNTPLGKVRVKKSTGYGVTREKIEYDDIAEIAAEKGISVREAAKIFTERD